MKEIVVFGEDFGGLPSSTQHIIKKLSRSYRVLWVNSIGLRQPTLSAKDLKRATSKIKNRFNSQQEASYSKGELHNIDVVNCLTIPAPRTRFARRIACEMIKFQLTNTLKKLKFDKPLFWTSLPTAVDVCQSMANSGVVYYCGDDFSALAGVDHNTVIRHESDLIQCADLILVASNSLASKFPPNKTYVVPHGVDYALFSTPTPAASDLPYPREKVIGFYGSLSNWLDYDLITQAALSCPDWAFVFIGPCELTTNLLPNLPNVHYLGSKPHADLPKYSQHWAISWLPFVDNEQIRACNPLKLLEYLAAGKPVISTHFPAIEPYKGMINIVNNATDVKRCIDSYLPLNKDKMSIVEQQSWDNKADFIDELVRQL
ncbi:glycosyltransferase [Vibrio rotiferianus]|uniref:glycosyltransferase n=1 Tax=Vibrio rotiferianus TaxID=190895 RepID=UPI00406A2423